MNGVNTKVHHTPGPWARALSRRTASWTHQDTFDIVAPRQAKHGGDALVAQVFNPGELRMTANAQLIASAPELYEALQALVELHYRDDYLGLAKQIQADAQAAIAKARGQS